ncbi:class I SAM-dependent methyltransferase [Erysipelothrix urinaevulpis]|uniref:class I SAM-dependent methyltransferase n=1 Tax=Erysipelothrix urinaevulpis TaxID=2683717 RepID=UPI0013585132|nr:class I SAM-dependent methyltransferase [Erysipelothrix urinaevulpis]
MNHKTISHAFLESRLNSTSSAVDMTCGNGHDTEFLATICRDVLAIDIQKEAIKNTQQRCQVFKNIEYLHMDHSQVSFKKRYDAYMYNLGYLPHSDKTIITHASTTLTSLKKIIANKPKYLSIACYRGHEGGNDEYQAIIDFLDALEIQYITLAYQRSMSPITLLIDFVNPSSSTILVDELRHLPQTQAHSILKSKLQLI